MVTDADTLIVEGISYRLDGIDAPEIEQVCLDAEGRSWSCGVAARDKLLEYLGTRQVTCEERGPDPVSRKRRIGICRVTGEPVTINQWLVRQGLAINFEPYSKGRFLPDEEQARSAVRGMWAGCFVWPRDYRRGNRETAGLHGARCWVGGEAQAMRLALFPLHPSEPPGCPIKATTPWRARVLGYAGIYFVPGCRNYAQTKAPRRWFCTEDDAAAAGFRKAYTC